jgi:cystathionine beta-synthase
VGTGGTISGVAKYLKVKNPYVQIWGIDTVGSVFKKYHETGVFDENEIYGYITEGIGEDILPKNVDFSLIDRFEKVTDKAGALAARELARKEGLLLGYSCGSAFQGLRQLKHLLNEDSVVVVLFHDHGSRYVGKIYNDDWMRERGFLNDVVRTAGDAVAAHATQPAVQVLAEEPLSNAVGVLKKFGISQAPVRDAVGRVGSIDESALLGALAAGKTLDTLVRDIMLPPLPEVDESTSLAEVVRLTHSGHSAVLVRLANGSEHVLSRHALLLASAQGL